MRWHKLTFATVATVSKLLPDSIFLEHSPSLRSVVVVYQIIAYKITILNCNLIN